MNETVSIKKENLLKAYEKSCDDVQDVLKDLFPDDIEEEEEVVYGFCCDNFEMYYNGTENHKKFIFDSEYGNYYVLPAVTGWGVKYCPTCGAHYDGKKWTPRV